MLSLIIIGLIFAVLAFVGFHNKTSFGEGGCAGCSLSDQGCDSCGTCDRQNQPQR